jgi:hypothetical protein
LTYLLDKLAEGKYVIASQLDTIKAQDSRLKRQIQSRVVKSPEFVTDAGSKGPVRKKRKRTEINYSL